MAALFFSAGCREFCFLSLLIPYLKQSKARNTGQTIFRLPDR